MASTRLCNRTHALRALHDQPRVFAKTREHLSGGDGCVECCGQRDMAFHVVSVRVLLNPGQVELLAGAAGPLRRVAVPVLVGVNQERKTIPR